MRRQVYVGNAQFVSVKYVKKLFGKSKGKIHAALERLDRLTKDEGLSAVAQTLGVVHESAKDINKMKRLLSLFPPFVAETDGVL